MDLEAFFLAHLDLIEGVIRWVSRRHRLSPGDADEFGAHARLRLIDRDYEILRRFEGRSSLRTYLTTVIQRTFLDWRIAQWGKWRPSAIAERLLGRVGGGTADVDWFVPHQANLRIIEAVARRVGVPMSRVMTNIERYGNTCAATIPSCLSEWHHAGRLRRGHHVVLASFGAGFTMAAASVRWAVPAPMSAPEVRAMPVDRQEILTAW